MSHGKKRKHKLVRIDPMKLKRAQKALRARNEKEAIELALDLAIEEYANRLTLRATERFVSSGIEIRDVYGVLDS